MIRDSFLNPFLVCKHDRASSLPFQMMATQRRSLQQTGFASCTPCLILHVDKDTVRPIVFLRCVPSSTGTFIPSLLRSDQGNLVPFAVTALTLPRSRYDEKTQSIIICQWEYSFETSRAQAGFLRFDGDVGR
jgi:hypothetical protein